MHGQIGGPGKKIAPEFEKLAKNIHLIRIY